MKKTIIYLFISISLGLSFTSCEDFLDRDPKDKISNANLLKDIEGIKIAMTGCYRSVAQNDYYRQDFILLSELMGGNAKITQSLSLGAVDNFVDFYGFNLAQDNDEVKYTYQSLYETLNQTNNIIHAIPNSVDGTTEEKNQILGEMYAIRALCHFDLLRLFAQPFSYSLNGQHLGIVIVTQTPDVFEQPPRSNVYDTYLQITDDLKEAINLTREDAKLGSTKKFWIGPAAAKALLARVYLYMEDWDNAAIMASEVIGDPNFDLVDGSSLRAEWQNNGTSEEDIWVLDNSIEQAEILSQYLGIPDVSDKMYCGVSRDLYDLYDPADLRLNLFTELYGDTTSYKYHTTGLIESDIVMIRLAEMYLIRAEAYAKTNQPVPARSDLQKIRQRANPNAAYPNFSGQDLIDEIMLERRRELAYEGHIFFDLKRTKSDIRRSDCSASLNHDLDYPDYRYVWPIPYDEVIANKNMIQNDRY